MGWSTEIRPELRDAAAKLAEDAKYLFNERYNQGRDMQLRLAEVLNEADIIELILARIARNGLGQPRKY